MPPCRSFEVPGDHYQSLARGEALSNEELPLVVRRLMRSSPGRRRVSYPALLTSSLTLARRSELADEGR